MCLVKIKIEPQKVCDQVNAQRVGRRPGNLLYPVASPQVHHLVGDLDDKKADCGPDQG